MTKSHFVIITTKRLPVRSGRKLKCEEDRPTGGRDPGVSSGVKRGGKSASQSKYIYGRRSDVYLYP